MTRSLISLPTSQCRDPSPSTTVVVVCDTPLFVVVESGDFWFKNVLKEVHPGVLVSCYIFLYLYIYINIQIRVYVCICIYPYTCT